MGNENNETHQSLIWRSEFGDTYTERNEILPEILRARIALWREIFESIVGELPGSILEVGANTGTNLIALKHLVSAELFAVEPNELARERLLENQIVSDSHAYDCLAHDLTFSDEFVDMVFTSGVLIHIHPDNLLSSCTEIYRVSRRYIVCIEYFSDKPEEIAYRGYGELLFKRDYGSFWMDNFSDLKLMDYGFSWKRVTGLDNLTWWIFKKPV